MSLYVNPDEENINLCPKGTRPYFSDRPRAGIFRRMSLRCNCDCLVVTKNYSDSRRDQISTRASVIANWNILTGSPAELAQEAEGE